MVMTSAAVYVLEWVNGLWFALSICVAATFTSYLVRSVVDDRGWYEKKGPQAAVGLSLYFAGESLMRGWVWLLLVVQNSGGVPSDVSGGTVIALLSAAFSTAGALCCIRIFSRSRWAWLWSGAFVGACAIMEAYYQIVR